MRPAFAVAKARVHNCILRRGLQIMRLNSRGGCSYHRRRLAACLSASSRAVPSGPVLGTRAAPGALHTHTPLRLIFGCCATAVLVPRMPRGHSRCRRPRQIYMHSAAAPQSGMRSEWLCGLKLCTLLLVADHVHHTALKVTHSVSLLTNVTSVSSVNSIILENMYTL